MLFQVPCRHKWKLVSCWLAGFVAAAVVWFAWPIQFISEAKILFRYVRESKSVTSEAVKSPASPADNNININSEIAFISSHDFAEQVANVVGPDRILQGRKVSGDPRVAAGILIVSNLQMDLPRKSSVLRLTFRHGDPIIARTVLNVIITNYLHKHLEVQRGKELTSFNKNELGLKQSRIEIIMGPGSVSNIAIVQAASNPIEVPAKARLMICASLLVAGFLLSLALVMCFEYADNSGKRSSAPFPQLP